MYKKILASFFLIWISILSLLELNKLLFLPENKREILSAKWDLLFVIASLYAILFVFANLIYLWRQPLWEKLVVPFRGILKLRERIGWLSFPVSLLLTVAVIYFFQYSYWGLIFYQTYIRLFIWLSLIYFLSFLSANGTHITTWRSFLLAVAMTSIFFGLASVYSNILSYPFNLYWSEGNRLWDYSLVFGRKLYNYPAGNEISSLTTFGRQVLWGIPFLFPHSTIWLNRLWSALLYSLPSIILGWILFKTKTIRKRDALILGLWAFLFLNQGPIYTPLILSAILVALAWERPWWLAVTLIAIAGYYAEISRYTWMLSPGVWAGMLSLNRKKLNNTALRLKDWGYAVVLGVSGLSAWIGRFFTSRFEQTLSSGEGIVDTSKQNLLTRILSSLESQPLLWERLLPNPTYSEGVLGGLLLAILPLCILLFSLYKSGAWKPLPGQWVAIFFPIVIFLSAGLIASTKIGGGNNLHNMDMFLITLLFVAAIAWRYGGQEYLNNLDAQPGYVKSVLLLAFVLPAIPAIRSFHPLLPMTETEIKRVKVLTGADVVEALPTSDKVNDALWAIDNAVEEYAPLGEVLFIDQRQLLTFGNVRQVPLVVEYEKKVLMNEALASDAEYFQEYYADLAAQRFSLIVSEPLKIPNVERDEASFAEEGDAWTVWVAEPTLCFYEPLFTLKDVYVQLLVPREDVQNCERYTE